MNFADEQPEPDEKEREDKLSVVTEYTNGFVEQGGVSTDLFVKAMGQEKTRTFFERVLFGTGR